MCDTANMMYFVGLTTTIIIVVIVAVITTLAVTVLIVIKIKISLKPDHRAFIVAQSNAAYGGGKTSSVPAEYAYETCTPTTTLDVQSNAAYGHVSGGKPTAIYETVSTDL